MGRHNVAAQNGQIKVVRYNQSMFMVTDLLNETDEEGNTPLHLAAAKLHSSILLSKQEKCILGQTIINVGIFRCECMDLPYNFFSFLFFSFRFHFPLQNEIIEISFVSN